MKARTVERFYLWNNMWEQMPELSVARYNASCCILANVAYVFCGTGDKSNQLNSIEVLSLEGAGAGMSNQWHLI